MKEIKLIAFAAMCMAGSYASAQDIIVTNDGKSMKVYNMEVSSESVFYQLEDSKDAPLQKILKSDILIVKKADGTKLDFSNTTLTNSSVDIQNNNQSTKIIKPIWSEEETKKNNKQLIDQYNVVFEVETEDKVKDKKANQVYTIFGMKENSVLTDGVLTMCVFSTAGFQEDDPYFVLEGLSNYQPSITIGLYNESDHIVYVDLGNSFYIPLGKAISYYTPTFTTTTNSSSSGVGVNLGTIANAVGIGGTVGTLANGVNVGHSSSDGVSHTMHNQRVIAIPPKTTYNLAERYIFNAIEYPCTGLRYRSLSGYRSIKIFEYCFPKSKKNGALMAGERCSYKYEQSPLNFSAIVSYSYTEDCSTLHKLSANMYLKDIVGNYDSQWTDHRYVKLIYEKRKDNAPVAMWGYVDSWGTSFFPKK